MTERQGQSGHAKRTVRAPRPNLVSPANFLVATRDSGYKTSALAVAEFIDNSIQAGARAVSVQVATGPDADYPIEITVTDDGVGMDAAALASALTFGGSTRFGDRSSLGRYGLGLPNGALSRARRVEVYSWTNRGDVLASRLDVDEMIFGNRRTLPPVEAIECPTFIPRTKSGTVVVLRRCDRLEYKRMATLVCRLTEDLGRIYRHFLARGFDLRVNGEHVRPVDPLFLLPSSVQVGGRQFGDTLAYSLSGTDGPGTIEVQFSELPVDHWHSLPAEEKRALGVTNSPCVSLVRAGREIDRGWFFMGTKRRENYDDWWRCEVRFEPRLDEHFGLTHSKQAVSPGEEIRNLLTPDLEAIGRALNSRVRRRFELVKVTTPLTAAESQAARAEAALPALPRRRENTPENIRLALAGIATRDCPPSPYRIVVSELATTAAFEIVLRDGQLVLLLNARHPLYRDLYGPLALSDSTKDQDVAKRVALALLAAARAEAGTRSRADRGRVTQFRQAWADVLATFLNA